MSLKALSQAAKNTLRQAPKATLKPAGVARAAQKMAGDTVQASASLQRSKAVAKLRNWMATEAAMPIQDGSRSRLLLHKQATGKGTVMLVHGFTSGTYQYDQLAPKLHKLGFDVFVPRLPGHGFKNAAGIADPSRLPRAGESLRYKDYADEMMALIDGLGGPVRVAGLSGGGNVALDIRNRHNVAGVVAMSPFLAAADGRARAAHRVFATLDSVTFGQASKLLDLLKRSWGKQPGSANPGHWHHTFGNVYSVSREGERVASKIKPSGAPIQFITTASDRAVSNDAIKRAYQRAGGPRTNGWYQFPLKEGVPHPMLSPLTNPKQESIEQINDTIVRFFDTGRLAQRGSLPPG